MVNIERQLGTENTEKSSLSIERIGSYFSKNGGGSIRRIIKLLIENNVSS